MGFYDWLNSLCPRLQHILQTRLKKEFNYDFELAWGATQNCMLMIINKSTGHYFPCGYYTLDEVVAASNVNNNDESALQKIAAAWESFPTQLEALRSYSTIGFGFAYDPINDVLYVTARLR